MTELLWEAFWKSTFVLGAALLASRAWHRRPASLRQVVLSAGMVATLAGVVSVAVAPRWTAARPSWLQGVAPPPAELAVVPPTSEPLAQIAYPSVESAPKVAVLGSRFPVTPSLAVSVAWLIGSALILARLLTVLLRLRRIRTSSRPIENRELRKFAESASAEVSPASRITVLENDAIEVPISWGVLRHVIVLPAGFHGLPLAHQSAVLYHELEHIQRRDSLMRVLAEVTCALLWFQPLVWIVRRKIREEQELACDDCVLARGTKPSSYAGALIEWQDRMNGESHVIAVGISDSSCLKRRLRAILDPRLQRGPVPTLASGMLWLAGLGLSVSLGTLSFADAIPPRAAATPVRVNPPTSRILVAQAQPVPVPQPASTRNDGVLDGRVVEDHSGSPLRSAIIRIASISSNRVIADIESDSQGRFQSPALTEGDYQLEISKPNYAQANLRIAVRDAAPTVLARLVRNGVITGRVSNSRQQPVSGAVVAAFRKPDSNVPARPDASLGAAWQAITNADGVYRIFGLPPGQYVVAMFYGGSSIAGLEQLTRPSTLEALGSGSQFYPTNTNPGTSTVSGGEEIRGVDFSIPAAAAPSSRYSISGGAAALPPGARIMFSLIGIDPPKPIGFMLNQTNTFQFQNLQPGSYSLLATGSPTGTTVGLGTGFSDGLFARLRVDVTTQDINGITVTPEKGITAKLVLRGSGGVCPAMVEAVLTPVEGGTFLVTRRVRVESGKEVEVPDLAPVPYMVSVNGLGDRCFSASAVLNPSSSPFEIQVAPLGSIHGRLQTGGRRTSDFAIVLVGNPGEAVTSVQVALPDAQSRFKFSGLVPGKYRIAARRQLGTPGARWLDDISGMIEFEVAGGAALEIDLAAPQTGGSPK